MIRLCLSFTLEYDFKVTSTLELPALTTLYLHGLTLCCDNNSDNCIALLSKCPNLKNLTLSSCRKKKWNNFSICHPQLSSLTLKDGPYVKVVNVVAPQLENLIIRYCSNNREHVISAPNLTSLVYDGYRSLHLSTYGFHSLKEADICVYDLEDEDAHQIVCMFQQFHNAKFLKLNLEIVEILSSSLEPILNQPSPFSNLKSIEVYPAEELSEAEEQKIVKMSNEVKNYLLDNSASATFTMVTREDSTTSASTCRTPLAYDTQDHMNPTCNTMHGCDWIWSYHEFFEFHTFLVGFIIVAMGKHMYNRPDNGLDFDQDQIQSNSFI